MDSKTKQSTSLIREYFIDYFRKNKHRYLRPLPVFNPNDPSLLFVNAGMNQLKDVFTGKKDFDEKYSQLTNSQICVRTGGKHNDFDDVGKDSYHLTSFEMLGNWSLNNHGKEQQINMCFDFLVNHCGLNPNQMYITYFEGTEEIPPDLETKQLWEKYIPSERIVPGNYKDNFWMMADTGPCGVSTEIHYDLIGNRDASHLVNKDDQTVIEIWNNVFVQYNKTDQGIYEKLDKFYIDAGMGLERIAMILQNKPTIYQIDHFRHLIGFVQAISGANFFTDSYEPKSSPMILGHETIESEDLESHELSDKMDMAYRIFVDHIRTLTVALFDGLHFGMHEREYILRKIMRNLLTNYYLYLNNMTVSPIMNNPAIGCIISFILCYHGKKRHDVKMIQNQMIDEEKLFIGIVQHTERKYKSAIRQFSDESKAIKHLTDAEGVPRDFIENKDKLSFVA